MESKKKVSVKKVLIGLGILAIFAVSIIPTWYFYNKYQESLFKLGEDTASPEQEVDGLIKEIGKHVLLPSGEQPTVATVTDANKLKAQNGFDRVKNGDRVLIYSSAKRAYIYRPESERVIDIVAVNFTEDSGGEVAGTNTVSLTPSASPSPSLLPTESPLESTASADIF